MALSGLPKKLRSPVITLSNCAIAHLLVCPQYYLIHQVLSFPDTTCFNMRHLFFLMVLSSSCRVSFSTPASSLPSVCVCVRERPFEMVHTSFKIRQATWVFFLQSEIWDLNKPFSKEIFANIRPCLSYARQLSFGCEAFFLNCLHSQVFRNSSIYFNFLRCKNL